MLAIHPHLTPKLRMDGTALLRPVVDRDNSKSFIVKQSHYRPGEAQKVPRS